jgi:hypothetical protein
MRPVPKADHASSNAAAVVSRARRASPDRRVKARSSNAGMGSNRVHRALNVPNNRR